MELNKTEMLQIEETTKNIAAECVAELSDLQLILVGGGAEVSFN